MRAEPFSLTVVGEDADFQYNVRVAHELLKVAAQETSCPSVDITAVLADDFVDTVERAWERTGAFEWHQFTIERVGGLVAAKNIVIAPDHSEIEIVFNSQSWRSAGDVDSMAQARRFWITAHEFMHPIFGRLRHASGAVNDYVIPAHTPNETARGIVRYAIEEMRCERLVDTLLSQTGTITTADGDTIPLRLGMLHNLGYCQAVRDALDELVYPGWPDIVETYQIGDISLEGLWYRIRSETESVVNLLGRAHAEALSVDYPGPLSNEAADHPATRLYLGRMWQRIVSAALGQPLLPILDDFAEMERALLDEGEVAILEMWRRLGIEVELLEDREFALWITDPELMQPGHERTRN